ncbi:hypothetical protein ACFSNO_24770 [Streptomyces cirratus]
MPLLSDPGRTVAKSFGITAPLIGCAARCSSSTAAAACTGSTSPGR